MAKPDSHAYAENLVDSRTVVVSFSSLGVNSTDKPFELLGLLDRTDCASIVLRDVESTWYLAMQNCPPANLTNFLRSRVAKYERIICLGYSMGGYAALRFGPLLGADEILAFAPQSMLSSRALSDAGDFRWEQFLSRVRDEIGDTRALDLSPRSDGKRVSIFIASHGDQYDAIHAERLLPYARVVRLGSGPMEHSALVVALRESGLLRHLVGASVANTPFEDEGRWFTNWETSYNHIIDVTRVLRITNSISIDGFVNITSNNSIDLMTHSHYPIRLGARLYSIAKQIPTMEYRFDFQSPKLEYGTSYPFKFNLPLSEVGTMASELRIALVREGRFWFNDLGLGQASLDFAEGKLVHNKNSSPTPI